VTNEIILEATEPR